MRRNPLRAKIPSDVLNRLHRDEFMKRCCLRDSTCEGKIEWHHHFTYAGRRQQEWWGILPLCTRHHAVVSKLRERLDKIMLRRMPSRDRARYPKVEWERIATRSGAGSL